MSSTPIIKIDGEVDNAVELTFEDLANIEEGQQVIDVSQIDPKRQGDAIKLGGLLQIARIRPTAKYIGLHSSTDDFHASIPLEPVRDRAILIYRKDGQPLDLKAGGPARFFIPDFAACHTDEIDECANVKFVDHIELTAEKGFDNRPEDDEEHEKLHQDQDG